MPLLLYLALVGTTLIIVRGTVFAALRRLWPALLRCCQCTGFWVGAAAGGSGIVPLGHGRALDASLAGAAISFLALAADAMLIRLLGGPPDHDGDIP